MSILITWGNINEINMISDTRMTITHPDGTFDYNENTRKIFKFNQTLIGVTGDMNYFSESLKRVIGADSFNQNSADYEEVFSLLIRYLQQQKPLFQHSTCKIVCAGLNKNNKIVLTAFDTNSFIPFREEPKTTAYASLVFANYNEEKLDAMIKVAVNQYPRPDLLKIIPVLVQKQHTNGDNTINTQLNLERIVKPQR